MLCMYMCLHRELVRGMSVVLKGSSDEKLDMSFRIYDLDGDGYVTRVELLGVIKSMYQVGDRHGDIERGLCVSASERETDTEKT